MAIIDDVTALLGFPEEKPNRTLDVIIRLTTNRLKTLLDVEEVPTELEYIVTEVSIVRYNKIGSEGVTSHSVEGETMSFSDNDFKGYLDDIEVWKNKKNEVVIHSLFFTMYHSIYNSIIPDIMHPPEAPFCFNSSHCFSSNLIPPIAYTGTFTVLQTSFKNPSPLGARPFLQSVT